MRTTRGVGKGRRLESALGDLRFQLSDTLRLWWFSTQAILVSNDKFLVLAFRGTEATGSVKDIKADARAKKTAVRNAEEAFGHTALQGRQDC